MAKKASGADPKPKQDADSEPEKGQDPGSEDGDGEVQEPQKFTLEEAKAALLEDGSFVDSILTSDAVRAQLQSERDTWGHQQTLPLKRQVEELESRLTEVMKMSDPDTKEYERLKAEGDYEGALALLEKRQSVAQAEASAILRGKQEGQREILAAVAVREEFSDLTQEDWTQVTANAMAEAQSMGRSYMTADQYIAHATRMVREKEKKMAGAAQSEAIQEQVKEAVEAELKRRGIKSREEDGGGEDPAGGGGGGGTYSAEQISKMSREELAKVPKEERDKAMAGS